jgi:hypothetical protein
MRYVNSGLKRNLLTGALIALSATGLFAQEATGEVSVDLFDAMSDWSEPNASVEEIAGLERPEAIQAYASFLRDTEGSVYEHFSDRAPQVVEEYEAIVGENERPADRDADFLAFLMAGKIEEYAAWQGDLKGRSFVEFVAGKFPELNALVEELNITPADRGVSLIDFVAAAGRDDLVQEAKNYFGEIIARPQATCVCKATINFPNRPSTWTREIDEHEDRWWNVGLFWKAHRKLDYTVDGWGAVRDLDFYRYSRRTTHEITRDKNTNVSVMRARLNCLKAGFLVCSGTSTCEAEMAVQIDYASRVNEFVDRRGNSGTRMLTADRAELTYRRTGLSAPQVLFQKGVSVSGETTRGWDITSVVQGLTAGGQLALNIVSADYSAALDAELVDRFIRGIFGAIKREGSVGNMRVAFDNLEAPTVLKPRQTHLFELTSTSRLYSRGYGLSAESKGNVDSNNHFVAVVREPNCGPDADFQRTVHWFWANTNSSPDNAQTLQNAVEAFIDTEAGFVPPNLSSNIGSYPY